MPKVAGVAQRLDAPMGVFGYRIDARPSAADLALARARAPARAAHARRYTHRRDRGLRSRARARRRGAPDAAGWQPGHRSLWLPAYLSQWNGASLVLPDEDAAALYHTEEAGGSLGRQYEAIGLDDIPLRYGHSYQLRVRLMDPTGGGPDEGDSRCTSRLPRSPRCRSAGTSCRNRFAWLTLPTFPPPAPAGPGDPDSPRFAGDVLHINRPRLGYPSVVFTGKYAEPGSVAAGGVGSLSQPVPGNRDRFAFGIPDPGRDAAALRRGGARAAHGQQALGDRARGVGADSTRTTRPLPGDVNAECAISR